MGSFDYSPLIVRLIIDNIRIVEYLNIDIFICPQFTPICIKIIAPRDESFRPIRRTNTTFVKQLRSEENLSHQNVSTSFFVVCVGFRMLMDDV